MISMGFDLENPKITSTRANYGNKKYKIMILDRIPPDGDISKSCLHSYGKGVSKWEEAIFD